VIPLAQWARVTEADLGADRPTGRHGGFAAPPGFRVSLKAQTESAAMAQPGMGFSKNEWIAFLVVIVLSAAGMTVDSMPIIIFSWSFVALILCYIIYSHSDVPASFRILSCTWLIILAAGLIYYLREAKIERDSHQVFGTMSK
jgi:hypothetical protein